MVRLILLVTAISCLSQLKATAEEPCRLFVAVPDASTAALLPPLPKGARLSVLTHKEEEAEETIHARAHGLRFATHFVYCSGCEAPLSAIYRERLQNHGAVVIDLRTILTSRSKGTLDLDFSEKRSLVTLLTSR